MPALNAISVDKLMRLIGTAHCPILIDVRDEERFGADPRLIPGSARHVADAVPHWAPLIGSNNAVVICADGLARSQGVAAWLRHESVVAEVLAGGFDAWAGAGMPLVPSTKLPPRDPAGRTVWVTRARPKIDRIACPWLIRRFVDRNAVFLYVPPSNVLGVAGQLGAAPFDMEGDGVFWSHRGDHCTFDTMIGELALETVKPLVDLATIVRGADTGRLELAPEAAGLLAASLGLSRIYSDDLEQLEAGMMLYDAFYRWCRDARDETHNRASHKPSRPEACQ